MTARGKNSGYADTAVAGLLAMTRRGENAAEQTKKTAVMLIRQLPDSASCLPFWIANFDGDSRLKHAGMTAQGKNSSHHAESRRDELL